MKKIASIPLLVFIIVIISGCVPKDNLLTSSILPTIESSAVSNNMDSKPHFNILTSSEVEITSNISTSSEVEITSNISSCLEVSSTISSNHASSNVSSHEEKNDNYKYTLSGIKLTPTDTPFSQTITRVYEDEELLEIQKGYRNSTITILEKLNTLYPVEHIKETDYGYSVVYVGRKQILIFDFDNKENAKSCGFLSFSPYKKEDFSQISLGDTHEKVLSVLPDGYHFWHGSQNKKFWSFYCTKDGYYVDIDYTYTDDEPYISFPEYNKLEISEMLVYAL